MGNCLSSSCGASKCRNRRQGHLTANGLDEDNPGTASEVSAPLCPNFVLPEKLNKSCNNSGLHVTAKIAV